MNIKRCLAVAGSAAALLGLVTLSGPQVWAQDATPEAEAVEAPRPAHIHSGNCEELGDVVIPLADLTAATGGDRVGQRRATTAENSFTSVPMALDAILAEDHAINIHLSAEEIDTYIACGELGGRLTADGALIVGLSEQSNSGYSGIAFLAPEAGGASTGVSVFIAPVAGGGGRNRDRSPEATPAAGGGDETIIAGEATPDAAEEAATLPEADTGEMVDASLTEFAIDVRDTLPAGPVTFNVTNDGTITHSFEVEGQGLEEELAEPLEPGQTGTLTVDLAPGTYEIYCPIGDHANQGMRVEVTVA